jgi:hypothetical protein
MSRKPNTIIGSLAAALMVAAVVAPGVTASERTATELGQATGSARAAMPGGEPSERTATELGQATGSARAAMPGGEPSERTATELGQTVGEPSDGNGAFARTVTELGQSIDLSPSLASSGEPGGSDWGAAAFVAAGGMALLIGVGGIVLFTRRRGAVRKPRTPVVSS